MFAKIKILRPEIKFIIPPGLDASDVKPKPNRQNGKKKRHLQSPEKILMMKYSKAFFRVSPCPGSVIKFVLNISEPDNEGEFQDVTRFGIRTVAVT